MDLNYWTTTILASGVVAAIVSGLFGYFGSLKVERLKNDLARRQGRATQLGEAHRRLVNLNLGDPNSTNDSESSVDLMQLFGDVTVGAVFRYAEEVSIYRLIRPQLADGQKDAINEKHNQAEAAQQQAVHLGLPLIGPPDGTALDASTAAEVLAQVMKTIDEFEVELKKQVEAAYEESLRIQEK